jgi:hypothetical protein
MYFDYDEERFEEFEDESNEKELYRDDCRERAADMREALK